MGAAARYEQPRRSAIRRITEGRSRWRVVVETWEEQDECCGKLLFCPDSIEPNVERESAALLRGRSHEDVLSLAHELPEERLRRVFLSLG